MTGLTSASKQEERKEIELTTKGRLWINEKGRADGVIKRRRIRISEMLIDESIDGDFEIKLDSIIEQNSFAETLEAKKEQFLQVTFPEQIFVYNLSDEVPKLVSFVL